MLWLLLLLVPAVSGFAFYSGRKTAPPKNGSGWQAAAPPPEEQSKNADRTDEDRKAQFRRQLDARLGVPQKIPSLDTELLEAYKQTPILRRLIGEELRKTIITCVRTHWLAGNACYAGKFGEIASAPECVALRQRVIEVAASAVDRLYDYPLLMDEIGLLQNLIVIRDRVIPTCMACPFLQCKVAGSRPYCDSAEYVFVMPDEVIPNKSLGVENVQA